MYLSIPESERCNRALVSSDQCIIDENQFYIRGCLEIPIIDSDNVFLWGLWAFVKENVFQGSVGKLAFNLSRNNEPKDPSGSSTGARPLFVVGEEHPLAEAQQKGISRDEAMELSSALLHIKGGSKSVQ